MFQVKYRNLFSQFIGNVYKIIRLIKHCFVYSFFIGNKTIWNFYSVFSFSYATTISFVSSMTVFTFSLRKTPVTSSTIFCTVAAIWSSGNQRRLTRSPSSVILSFAMMSQTIPIMSSHTSILLIVLTWIYPCSLLSLLRVHYYISVICQLKSISKWLAWWTCCAARNVLLNCLSGWACTLWPCRSTVDQNWQSVTEIYWMVYSSAYGWD